MEAAGCARTFSPGKLQRKIMPLGLQRTGSVTVLNYFSAEMVFRGLFDFW